MASEQGYFEKKSACLNFEPHNLTGVNEQNHIKFNYNSWQHTPWFEPNIPPQKTCIQC